MDDNDHSNDFKFVRPQIFRRFFALFPARQTKIESNRDFSNEIDRSTNEIILIAKKTEEFSEKESAFKIRKKRNRQLLLKEKKF